MPRLWVRADARDDWHAATRQAHILAEAATCGAMPRQHPAGPRWSGATAHRPRSGLCPECVAVVETEP
jgi:hypothetical protein